MKNATWTLEILQTISDKTIQRERLNQLIELTQRFAYTYLKYRYRNLNRLLLAEDVNLKEMAVDAIAPLFERDDSGTLKRINNAFLNWIPPIETEEQALFFLNRLAAKSTEKYVSELLKESDPFFSKILRSVNYLIDSRGYLKKQFLGTTYIIKQSVVDLSGLPSTQFIYDLPDYLFTGKNDIIGEVFEYIKQYSNKSEAVPVNALVIKIKKAGAKEFIIKSNTGNEDSFEIESILNQAVYVTFNKLESSYLKKNKINVNQADALKKALQKIVVDLQDGGINTGLHKYLIEEMPSLRFEDYRKNYQNIFEYLYKVLKREIIRQIRD